MEEVGVVEQSEFGDLPFIESKLHTMPINRTLSLPCQVVSPLAYPQQYNQTFAVLSLFPVSGSEGALRAEISYRYLSREFHM